MRALCFLPIAMAALAAVPAHAAPIPATVTGSGAFDHSASILADGVIPGKRTNYTDDGAVNWANSATTFTFDFGAGQSVGSLLLSADNNDVYTVSASLDGMTFSTLLTVLPSDGTATFGLDIFSTDPSSPDYLPGSAFQPVSARYLQLQASGGDSRYGAGELQAFAPVPEPASFALLGAGTGAAMVRRRRA